MKPPSRIALRLAATAHRTKAVRPSPLAVRSIHSTPPAPATVSPIHGHGPPPDPPQPAADSEKTRVERRKKQAELLQKAKDIRAGGDASTSTTKPTPTPTPTPTPQQPTPSPPGTAAKDGSSSSSTAAAAAAAAENRRSALARKRFWRDVHVREVDGALEVHLDARPLRHPATKRVVRLPLSKPLLAGAVALEWDLLVSAQAATRQHLIPLTSLVCRALDIREDDAAWEGKGAAERGGGGGVNVSVSVSLRRGIVEMVMRYLDTDTLLCWAPPYRDGIDDPITVDEGAGGGGGGEEEEGGFDVHDPAGSTRGKSLRDAQRRAAGSVVAFLTSRVWPGIAIEPVLDGETIMPRQQPPGTRQVVEGWVSGLDAWELAGLERAVLAGKGLLGAARLLVEWSEGGVGVGVGDGAGAGAGATTGRKFGIEEATRLANIEVDYQIGRWGEVEDTHDVEREDLRRQFGSVVLLVSGLGSR